MSWPGEDPFYGVRGSVAVCYLVQKGRCWCWDVDCRLGKSGAGWQSVVGTDWEQVYGRLGAETALFSVSWPQGEEGGWWVGGREGD